MTPCIGKQAGKSTGGECTKQVCSFGANRQCGIIGLCIEIRVPTQCPRTASRSNNTLQVTRRHRDRRRKQAVLRLTLYCHCIATGSRLYIQYTATQLAHLDQASSQESCSTSTQQYAPSLASHQTTPYGRSKTSTAGTDTSARVNNTISRLSPVPTRHTHTHTHSPSLNHLATAPALPQGGERRHPAAAASSACA